MMFRDEADIISQTLQHWYNVGVRNFYLCDNLSTDRSLNMATLTVFKPDVHFEITDDPGTDWPGAKVLNGLKNRALEEGCDWIFPIDADEQIALPHPYNTIQDWIATFPTEAAWYEMPYLNILPNGRMQWQEPHRKAFGLLQKGWTISVGNHIIHSKTPQPMPVHGAHYRHFSIRSYEQFKRKMENWMTAFHNSTMKGHHHAIDYHQWQEQGEEFIVNKYNQLCSY